MEYTKEYFIEKFSKIPKAKWGEIYVDKAKKMRSGSLWRSN